jgi:hypothetical protein
MLPSRLLIFLSLIVMGLALLTGCQSADSKAQSMLSQGQFQQVMDQFPNTQYAQRARAMMAEKLFQERNYDELLKNYSDTPAAYRAKQAEAQRLFDKGDYQAVIDKFAKTTLGNQAEQILSDSLYNAGAYDDLVARFPESAKAKIVFEQRAVELYDKAKKLSGQAKIDALDQISTQYRGTTIWKDAANELRELRNTKQK